MKEVHQRLQRLVESDVCQAENVEEYREELIQLAGEVADLETVKGQSRFFKALSEEKRLRILKLLRVRDMCVCELMIALDMTQPNLSHHIRIMENEGLVTRIKKGKWVFCAIANRELVEKMYTIKLL